MKIEVTGQLGSEQFIREEEVAFQEHGQEGQGPQDGWHQGFQAQAAQGVGGWRGRMEMASQD